MEENVQTDFDDISCSPDHGWDKISVSIQIILCILD